MTFIIPAIFCNFSFLIVAKDVFKYKISLKKNVLLVSQASFKKDTYVYILVTKVEK